MSKNQLITKLDKLESLLKKRDEKPLNFIEAAQYLSISHSTLYKLTYQRKIPCHKPTGKVLYFFKHELDEWISKGNEEFRIENEELKNGKRKKRIEKHGNKNEDDEEPDG